MHSVYREPNSATFWPTILRLYQHFWGCQVIHFLVPSNKFPSASWWYALGNTIVWRAKSLCWGFRGALLRHSMPVRISLSLTLSLPAHVNGIPKYIHESDREIIFRFLPVTLNWVIFTVLILFLSEGLNPNAKLLSQDVKHWREERTTLPYASLWNYFVRIPTKSLLGFTAKDLSLAVNKLSVPYQFFRYSKWT